MSRTGLAARPGRRSRTAPDPIHLAWIWAGVAVALAACQPVPQPSWSPSLEPSSRWVASEETPTPVPEQRPEVQEAAYVPGSPHDGGRAPIRGDLGTIRFEQDREVWTIGWVALPRSGRAYPVMHVQARLSGTVQAEMSWSRAPDDFAMEVLLPDGSFQSASRSGQKESTSLFLNTGARATIYLTRFSDSDTAPKLVLRFSSGAALQEEDPVVAAEPEPPEAPEPDFGELDLPPPLDPEPADEEPVAPPPTEPPPIPTAMPPTPRPARTAARKDPPQAARKTPTAASKPRGSSRKTPRAEERVPARAKARTPTPRPAAVPAATAAASPTQQAGGDQATVGQPQKGVRISPRGEAARVPLGAEQDSLSGRQSIVLDIPEARLEITVPRGFEVTVTDDRGRSVPLIRNRLFEVWEGIPGTEHSFLSDTHTTRPLRIGHYSVEVRGPLSSVRFRGAKGSFSDGDLGARYKAQLVLVKRLR